MSVESSIASQTFKALAGAWRGSNTVFFDPTAPPVDSSEIHGGIELIAGEKLFEFAYNSNFQGKTIDGKLIVSYDPKLEQCLMSWVDSFHNSQRIMQLAGDRGNASGRLTAFGEYPAGESLNWGWRIELLPSEMTDIDGHSQIDALLIRHFNVPPDEVDQQAVIWELTRMTS